MAMRRTKSKSEKGPIIIGLAAFLLITIFLGVYLFRKGEQQVYRPKRIAKRVKIELPPPSLEADREQISSRVEIEQAPQVPVEPEKSEEKPIIKKKAVTTSVAVSREKEKKPKIVSKIVRTPVSVKNWVVNVVSTPSKSDAAKFLERLRKGGYQGYITEFNYKNKLWYRVRVGFYSSKKEAGRVGEKISNKYLLKSYWAVKASDSEIMAHIR